MVRLFSVIVAVMLSVPFLAILLDATAQLVSIASNQVLDPLVVMWAVAVAVIIVATLGGLRGVAQSGPLQMTLIVAGVGLAGLAAYHLAGGFSPMKDGLTSAAASGLTRWGNHPSIRRR